MKRKLTVVLILAGLAFAAAGCGSGSTSAASGETVQVDVGNDTPIDLPVDELRVGLFTLGTTDANLQLILATVQDEVDRLGWDLKVYDASFDSATQLNQMQNAIQRKEIDAAIVMPVDSQLHCKAVTEDLPAANILVVGALTAICGGETGDGPAMWRPGILTWVGGADNVPVNRAWIDAVVESNPGPQKAVILGGPKVGAFAIAVDTAVQEWRAANPDSEFDVFKTIETDFTTADTAEKTRALLQANSDITVLMSVNTPDMTRGVVQAVGEAGRLGDITIVDQGAKQFTLDQIRDGNVQLSLASYSVVAQGKLAVRAIKDAQHGKEVPQWIDDLPPENPGSDPLIVTIDNVDEVTPEN
jgi:ABC-type sugar transport system substrate-binding protein